MKSTAVDLFRANAKALHIHLMAKLTYLKHCQNIQYRGKSYDIICEVCAGQNMKVSNSLRGEWFSEQGDAEDEANERRAPFDGTVHGDVHPVEGAETQSSVQGEAERRREEITAVLEAERWQVEHADQPKGVQERHRQRHLRNEKERDIANLR